MAKTAVGVFEGSATADKAITDLLASGFSRDEIKLIRRSDFDPKPAPETDILQLGGVPPERAGQYWEAVRDGREVVALTADDDRANSAAAIMNQDGAIAVDERAAQPVASGPILDTSDDPGFFPERSGTQLFDVS
jgi:hypothetical protein